MRCDIIREKEKTDPQVFKQSITDYFKDKERDSKRLMEYARQSGIAERTTVDIDITVKGLQMEEAEIRKAVENFL